MRQMCYFLCILSLCMGCNGNKEKSPQSGKEATDSRADSIRENSVFLTLHPKVFTVSQLKEKAGLTMTNKTSEPITTGESYSIEYLEDGKWKMLEAFEELFFISIGYQITPGNAKEFKVGFLADKHKYRAGQYRIVKSYMKEKDLPPKTLHNIYFNFLVR